MATNWVLKVINHFIGSLIVFSKKGPFNLIPEFASWSLFTLVFWLNLLTLVLLRNIVKKDNKIDEIGDLSIVMLIFSGLVGAICIRIFIKNRHEMQMENIKSQYATFWILLSLISFFIIAIFH